METCATRLSLLTRVRDASDARAWSEFEQRYSELVLRYALARGLQFADAEDVRQVVFLRLAKALRDFTYSPARGRFRSYLGAMVKNVIRDRANCPATRRHAVDELAAGLESIADPRDTDADARWEQEWVQHHCRLALETVRRTFDPSSVAVFEDFLQGGSADDVAARHNMTLAAVVKIRQRVRERMQGLIRDQVHDEDAA